jgi:hypothetical protein
VLFADNRANRQAFSACLDFARPRGAGRIVCLGDIVGYGADPAWAVDTVMGLVADGAVAGRGLTLTRSSHGQMRLRPSPNAS